MRKLKTPKRVNPGRPLTPQRPPQAARGAEQEDLHAPQQDTPGAKPQ
jgi:hypothetical protein